jgi:WD40 repeat protein
LHRLSQSLKRVSVGRSLHHFQNGVERPVEAATRQSACLHLTSATFSPDGSRIVTASEDKKTARIRDKSQARESAESSSGHWQGNGSPHALNAIGRLE